MEEYAAEMEKHERQRQEQVEALKVWQAKQEKVAKARPEAKRWIDPAIIDRWGFGSCTSRQRRGCWMDRRVQSTARSACAWASNPS